MCEKVKRNNGGYHLGGRLFDVTDHLIREIRQQVPEWNDKDDKWIAKTIVNGTSTFDLACGLRAEQRTKTTLSAPGGQRVECSIFIEPNDQSPRLFPGEWGKMGTT